MAFKSILTKIESAYSPEARAKGLALRYIGCDSFIHTDPVLYQRIIGNLVANAIRYTERGGILVGCRRSGGKMWVQVWDTGIGIPADRTNEIFEEFRQLGAHAQGRHEGSGLGLAIVAKTADLLGLEIRVRSKIGKGSMFAVELPIGHAAAPAPPQCDHHRPLRIALIEDNAEVAEALSYVLTNAGHTVVSASSPFELLPRLGDFSPELAISDYRLDGELTGLGAIDAIRETLRFKIPAIIITGDTSPDIIKDLAAHEIDVLHKPLDYDVLQVKMATLCKEVGIPL